MSAYPFPVEFVPKLPQVYHGPKRRMVECLRSFASLTRSRMREKEFLDYIVSTYPQFVRRIQKVKFYKYSFKGMVLHFAVFWTADDAVFRDRLFEESNETTSQTGWYPLVTGSRVSRRQTAGEIHIRESLRKCMNRTKFESTFDLGVPISLEQISLSGNAFLLKTSTWNILFDTGMRSSRLDLNRLDDEKKTMVILSHAHSDHDGGLRNIILSRDFFLVATEITLDLVLNRYDYVYGLDKLLPDNFFYRVFPARYDCVYKFVKGGSLSFFDSSHYPGGVMTLIRFKNGKSLLYTGDFSFSDRYGTEARSTLIREDSMLWNEAGGYVDWCLVDAALGLKTEEAITYPESYLTEVVSRSFRERETVMFLIKPKDLGFFLYLDLASKFLVGRGKCRVPFYLDPFLRRLLNTVDKYFRLKRTHSLWPAIQPLLKQRKNITGTVWLYGMDQNWVKNLAYHHSKGLAVLLILDYDRAVKDGYGNASEFQRLAVACNKVFFIGENQKEFGQHNARRRLRTSWADIELDREILILSGDNWLPHCSVSELESLLRQTKTRVKINFLFHQKTEALDGLSETLREKLKSNIYGLSGVQKLE